MVAVGGMNWFEAVGLEEVRFPEGKAELGVELKLVLLEGEMVTVTEAGVAMTGFRTC
jgi:hypothetical protein